MRYVEAGLSGIQQPRLILRHLFSRAEDQLLSKRSAPSARASVHYPSVDTFVIRPALISERRELEDLQLRASLNNPGDRDAILAHPDAIELPLQQIAGGRVFVSEQNGTIVGFAAVEPRADGESELDALFVDPSMQRHGIGRSLLAHCAQFARAQGSGALHVVGNPHAEAFYIACGFNVIGTAETRFGTGLLMRMMI